MDINECYRVLELEVGAPREAVDAAYRRLVERWSPERAAAGTPEEISQARRLVETINEAHRTLLQAAADSAKPSTAAPGTGAKPTLRPLTNVAQPSTPPPPPRSPAPPPPVPPPVVIAPAPAPTPPSAAPEPEVAAPAASPDLRSKVMGIYEAQFPAGSPRRRFAPVILGAAFILILLLGKCAFSSSGGQSASARAAAAAPDPQTLGQLHVKSNRADTTIEAMRTPVAGEAPASGVNGPAEGAAEQTLAGLRPGKYVLTARSAGWPELSQEATVEATRTTEVAIHFKSGSLRLDTDPSGARVRLGETVFGQTPLLIPQLPPGESKLVLEYPSWPAVTVKTTITENVESAATVRLPHGKLTVESSPAGATVLLGGKSIGQTPLVIERLPAGSKKLTLQGKDFPPLELAVTVEDRGDVKVNPALASVFPVLDPEALLRAVWVPDNPDRLSLPNDGVTGPSAPRNEIIKNLNRKRLYEEWLRRRYCLTAEIKAYDAGSGQIEFVEQKSELSKYRVLAKLSPRARADKELAARLTKGASIALYGQLTAAEEPRWPFKVITLELSAAEPLR